MGGVFRHPENKGNNKGRNLVKANPSFKILQIKCGAGENRKCQEGNCCYISRRHVLIRKSKK